jgi:hypothetical protein
VIVGGAVAGATAPLDQGGTVALATIVLTIAGAAVLARATRLALNAASPDAPADGVSSAWR